MILIGIGSNLNSTFGDRFKNIDLSIKYLEKENLKILKKSSYYETPSYPNQDNPKFINVVVSIDSAVTFENLISKTINIEEILERKKGIRNCSVLTSPLNPHVCFSSLCGYSARRAGGMKQCIAVGIEF